MYSGHDLANLVMIADTGSVRAASRALGRTQPAVTQAIRRLEKAVGFALLDRSGYRAKLTEAGEIFADRARVAVAQTRGLHSLANVLACGVEPRVRLAVHSAIPSAIWLSLVENVRAQFPETTVEIEAGEGLAPYLRLTKEAAHLALLLEPFPERHENCVEAKPLGEIEYVNVIRTDRKGSVTDIAAEIPQVLASDFEDLSTSYALEDGQKYWRVSNNRMKAEVILAGNGWGYVPRTMIQSELLSGILETFSCRGVKDVTSKQFAICRKLKGIVGPVAAFIWQNADMLQF